MEENVCLPKWVYWVWSISIVALGLSITSIFWGYNIKWNVEIISTAIILVFVGILATFVVVSNYAQVSDIKKEFIAETAKNKEEIEGYKNKISDVISKVEDLEKNIKQLEDSLKDNTGNVSKAEDRISSIEKIIDDKVEYLFSVLKNMYHELLKIKEEPDFKKYGLLEKGSPYYYWWVRVHELVNSPEAELLNIKKDISFDKLESLGCIYDNSKGKDTTGSNIFNGYFKEKGIDIETKK